MVINYNKTSLLTLHGRPATIISTVLFMCSLDEGKEDKVNLNCSNNDQQWRAGWWWGGGGGHAEAWWASRGGSSDARNAREGGRGRRRVRMEGAGMNEGWKRTPWENRGQLHCSTRCVPQQTSRLMLKSKSCVPTIIPQPQPDVCWLYRSETGVAWYSRACW